MTQAGEAAKVHELQPDGREHYAKGVLEDAGVIEKHARAIE